MIKLISYLLLGLCLCFYIPANAQIGSADSVYFEPGFESEDEELPQENDLYFKPRVDPKKVTEQKISEEKVLAIKNEEDYWYADLHPSKKEPKPRKNNAGINNQWNTFFWILLVGGFIALIVWFLTSGNINLFRRAPKVYQEDQDMDNEEDIFEVEYEREIQNAVNAGNFRLAVRLMYLQTLKEMSERNIIRYSNEKTNSDYLFQLAKSRHYKSFFRLTRHFDYIWYGQFVLSPEAFQSVQKDFSSFKQQLN